MSVDYTDSVVGRSPMGQMLSNAMIQSHPEWSDQQIADRINREYEQPVITADEVAHWREQTP